MFNEATVVNKDVLATSGIVHSIDTVLGLELVGTNRASIPSSTRCLLQCPRAMHVVTPTFPGPTSGVSGKLLLLHDWRPVGSFEVGRPLAFTTVLNV